MLALMEQAIPVAPVVRQSQFLQISAVYHFFARVHICSVAHTPPGAVFAASRNTCSHISLSACNTPLWLIHFGSVPVLSAPNATADIPLLLLLCLPPLQSLQLVMKNHMCFFMPFGAILPRWFPAYYSSTVYRLPFYILFGKYIPFRWLIF